MPDSSTKPAASKKTKTVTSTSIPSQVSFGDSSEDETWDPASITQESEDDTSYLGEDVTEVAKEDSEHFSIDLGSETESEDDDLPDISKMSLRSFKPSSFKFEFPFIIYPYTQNRQIQVCVDFLVLSMPRENFKCRFNSNGTEVLLYTKIPGMFTAKERVLHADDKLGENTSKAVAFEEVIGEYAKNRPDEGDGIYGPPQVIRLPFPCDTTIPIEHEMQAFEGWIVPDANNPLEPGDSQYYMILSIDIESKKKAIRRVIKGGMQVFKSPNPII